MRIRSAIIAALTAAAFAACAAQPSAADEADVTRVMEVVKSNRLFRAIFQLHPEAEAEAREKVRVVLEKPLSVRDQAFEGQRIGGELVAKYFLRHIGDGSLEVTYRYMQQTLRMMQHWASKPDLCVAYHMGKPHYEASELTPELIAEETNMKADLLESVAATPMPLTTPPDVVELRIKLYGAYVAKGYAPDDLALLQQVPELPAMEGCEIATEFIDAIVSMGQDEGATTFKQLVYLSTHQ